jgi:hypothetical protein
MVRDATQADDSTDRAGAFTRKQPRRSIFGDLRYPLNSIVSAYRTGTTAVGRLHSSGTGVVGPDPDASYVAIGVVQSVSTQTVKALAREPPCAAGLRLYVRSMESDPAVAGDRRRSHVIDVGRRLAGIDALKMYDRNDRSPVAGRRERQRRNEEGSHTHRRENGIGDAGGPLQPDGSGGSRLRLRRLVHLVAGVASTCEASRHRLSQRSRCRMTGSS